MADGVRISDIQNLATGPQIVASDSGNVNGLVIDRRSVANGPTRFNRPPNPADPYVLDVTGYTFDAAGTSADPCEVEVSFGVGINNEITVKLSELTKIRYDANEVLVTPVSAEWDPDQAVNTVFNQPIFIYRSDVGAGITHTSGAVTRIDSLNGDGTVDGSNHLKLAAGATQTANSPTYDALTKSIAFGPSFSQTGDNPIDSTTIMEFDSALSVGTFLIVFKADATQANGLSILGTPQRGMRLLTGNAAALNLFSDFDAAKVNWNGDTNGSGSLSFDASYTVTPGYENVAAAQIPTATTVAMLVEFNPASGGVNIKTLGGAFDANSIQDGKVRGTFDGDIYAFLAWPLGTVLPDDYKQHLTGWIQWLSFNAGWTASLDLPADHDYGSGNANSPPGGGAAPTVFVTAPVLSITIKNAPTGAALNIWDDEDANASADHGTLLFNATPDGTDKIWNSGLTPGNRVVIQWVPASPYLFKEINFPYVIPNNSVEFDLTPLLIAEDGI